MCFAQKLNYNSNDAIERSNSSQENNSTGTYDHNCSKLMTFIQLMMISRNESHQVRRFDKIEIEIDNLLVKIQNMQIN